MSKESLINRLKTKFKSFPQLYYFIAIILGPILYKYKHYRALLKLVPEEEAILNLGSGPREVSDKRKIINLDIYTYKNVNVLADIQRIPFKDNSIGGVIDIVVLEHIENPHLVINEIFRILKPGGYTYTVVPFIFGYHSSPNDFYRWTPEGIKKLFSGFEEIEIGIYSGPTSAMLLMLHEWLSLFFSLQNRYLYQILWIIFMIILAPFKIIDFYLSRHPEAYKIAATFYYICKKPKRIPVPL